MKSSPFLADLHKNLPRFFFLPVDQSPLLTIDRTDDGTGTSSVFSYHPLGYKFKFLSARLGQLSAVRSACDEP